MSKNEKSDVKFSEKISLKIRKTIIVSKLFTCLIVLLLICAFIGLNVWVQSLDLPQIDVTANKIYTLSDGSKEALKDINQDIKIYIFGIDENNSVVGLIKQYCSVNDKITYEMLSKESNLAKVQEFELEDGYSIIVIESGESKKIIDASTEFQTYDYTTYEQVDVTEQTLTNSILSLVNENKPKVYFTEGHSEFGSDELGVLMTYLNNEAIETSNIDLATTGAVPEDCDVLAIMSPSSDFFENEVQAVVDYINRGGNLFITRDVLSQDAQLLNFAQILAYYGVNVENGYILERDSKVAQSNYPFIFKPQISETNSITSEIYSDSYMLLAYAEKINFASSEELENLKVTYEPLLETSDTALFVTDFASDAETAASTAQSGKFTIAADITKTISETSQTDENGEEKNNSIKSQLVLCANGRFMTDYIISEISNQYPISYVGSNKDFGINAISVLAKKENGLKIRKDMAGTSYVFSASAKQNTVVLGIIFSVPVLIIIAGIIVGKHRKKRK